MNFQETMKPHYKYVKYKRLPEGSFKTIKPGTCFFDQGGRITRSVISACGVFSVQFLGVRPPKNG